MPKPAYLASHASPKLALTGIADRVLVPVHRTSTVSRIRSARRIGPAAGLLILGFVCSGLTATSAAAASRPAHVPATQALTRLLYAHGAHRSPSTGSPVVASVPAETPITGEPTTLPVIGRAKGLNGSRWLRVRLPGRPNGLTGWIARGGTRELLTRWHIYVDLSDRRLSIYLHGRLWKDFSADVGTASTPTPTGSFFVQENVIMPAGDAGGPFALALSARSDVLHEFNGGPGQIAIHGLNFIGGPLDAAASHGCVRLATPALTWLADRIGPGVPVTIYR